MDPLHLPGNEPDPGDMAHDPSMPVPSDLPDERGLPDDEADRIGDFA